MQCFPCLAGTSRKLYQQRAVSDDTTICAMDLQEELHIMASPTRKLASSL